MEEADCVVTDEFVDLGVCGGVCEVLEDVIGPCGGFDEFVRSAYGFAQDVDVDFG